jgi:hypothetical protein
MSRHLPDIGDICEMSLSDIWQEMSISDPRDPSNGTLKQTFCQNIVLLCDERSGPGAPGGRAYPGLHCEEGTLGATPLYFDQ